jgi:hypothetical protein
MTKQKKSEKPSDLVKGSRRSTTPELAEKDLDKVSGGAGDFFLKLDGIKGESQDDNH